jgi:hypothetical protein
MSVPSGTDSLKRDIIQLLRKIIIQLHQQLTIYTVLRARIICLMTMHPGSGPEHK